METIFIMSFGSADLPNIWEVLQTSYILKAQGHPEDTNYAS